MIDRNIDKIRGKFFNKHIISVDQFERKDIDIVFEKARKYKRRVEKGEAITHLSGKILCALFYEPSSRTFSSFITAIQRLGGGIIPIQDVSVSSVSKGETLEDTIRVFGSYADVIALRHNQKGAALASSLVSSVPIINAGDGTGEHPTQALLDLFTIYERLGKIDGVSVAMVGDLKYGRTVHSLSKILSLYKNITLYFVCPKTSSMPSEVLKVLKARKVTVKTISSIEEIIDRVDVLYMTRVQKERITPKLYESIKDLFVLNAKLAGKMKKKSIIMHPLPRVHEIARDVDANPRAVYLTHQMRNGMYIRMALLSLVLTK